MITLKNDMLQATIHPLGAELQSLRSTAGLNYLWNGDAKHWGKFSPVLFPIVGSLVNNAFQYHGKSYTMARHGFARERMFRIEEQSADEVLFALRADASSLTRYPFSFGLRLRYTLEKSTLTVGYEVTNQGQEPMYFSVGGHPAFAVPLTPDTQYEDYFIAFEKEEPLERWKLKDGLISPFKETLATQGSKLFLKPSLFYDDAIVLKQLQSKKVTLACTKHSHGLHFNFDGFPYLGLWAAKDAPFLCIEPWCGHADETTHNQQLTEKAGIIELGARRHWSKAWSVECF